MLFTAFIWMAIGAAICAMVVIRLVQNDRSRTNRYRQIGDNLNRSILESTEQSYWDRQLGSVEDSPDIAKE